MLTRFGLALRGTRVRLRYPVPSTQYPVPSAQYPVLSTQYLAPVNRPVQP